MKIIFLTVKTTFVGFRSLYAVLTSHEVNLG